MQHMPSNYRSHLLAIFERFVHEINCVDDVGPQTLRILLVALNCVCVCLYLCMYVHAYVHAYEHASATATPHVSVYMCVCKRMQTYVHTYEHASTTAKPHAALQRDINVNTCVHETWSSSTPKLSL